MRQLSKSFMVKRRSGERGFTLIELLFAMSFVSVLLIVILTAGIQLTRIYNKGITLKQVNQSGAAIGAELQSSIKDADPQITTDTSSGRLCLGSYSYVWNLQGVMTNKYAGDSTPIGLVKVSDATKAMCSGTPKPNVPKALSTELLLGATGTSSVQLQLRDFSIEPVANSGLNYVYEVSYTVATDDHKLIDATSNVCKGGADDSFCALNTFTFDVFAKKGGSGKV